MTAATLSRRALGEDQLQAWRDDGYLVFPDFFPADQIAAAAAEADQLLERHRALIDVHNLRTRFLPNVVAGGDQFECFDPVIDLSLECHRLALDPRLLAALGALYGEAACLFKDKLVYKPPGVKGYDLHQDYTPWASFPRSFLTLLIPLDPVDLDNGCTEVFPGYHKNGLLAGPGKPTYPLPPDAVDESRAVPLILNPGDVAVFDGFTPHRSAPNRSLRWRRQFFPSYNKLSDGGHQRPQHYAEFRNWLKKKYEDYGKTGLYYT
jgi:ectoine hydroxylase-related dioxygenase (phytanoyl-CoA dioxygenase family)